jgi:hypothetical protein
MKKILSILLAVALCATFTVCAFAADADSTKVSDEVLGDIVDGLGDLINAETDENDAALEKAIEELYAALNDANAKGDTSALIEQLKDYANGADVDISDALTDLGALQDVVEKFLNDGGFDLEKIKKDLENDSALNKLVGLYAGSYTKVPTPTTTNPSTTPTEINPPTGESISGIAIALSVLVASAGAAVVVCAKKKED